MSEGWFFASAGSQKCTSIISIAYLKWRRGKLKVESVAIPLYCLFCRTPTSMPWDSWILFMGVLTHTIVPPLLLRGFDGTMDMI